MFGQNKSKIKAKMMLLELKSMIQDRMIEQYEDKIADLQSTVNLQRATIEGLKSGRYLHVNQN
jgi:uncharacterized coiled-coil protein SlyX